MNLPREEFPVTLLIAKEGELRWLGHLDFARSVERALRRAALPLRFTEGFHRRVKQRLPEPLPLGVGSDAERFVVPLAQERSAEEVSRALEPCLPRGLSLRAVLRGALPERKDAAIELELDAAVPGELEPALQALPATLPAIGGTWERLEPPGDAIFGRAIVRLVPPAGSRVSIGRFLELLNRSGPQGFALARIHRRVAWRVEEASLPSSAPFVGRTPCTP